LPKAAFKSEETSAEKTEIKEETEEDVKPQVIDLENENEVKENKSRRSAKKENNNPYAHLGEDVVTKKEEITSEDDDEDEMLSEDDEEEKKPNQKKRSDDVSEGKTLFIRNVPFSATQESLSDLFKSYGDLVYALLVVDPLTEHPKGTAFVKYKVSKVPLTTNHNQLVFNVMMDFAFVFRMQLQQRHVLQHATSLLTNLL